MAVQWYWMILLPFLACTLGIHGLSDPWKYHGDYKDVLPSNKYEAVHREDMLCQSCAGNLSYEVRAEECTPRGNAVMSSAPKIRHLINQVISTYDIRDQEPLLSLFLHQLLGGYIPDCPLECYGAEEDTVMYLCSLIGGITMEDFQSYIHTNLNSPQEENKNDVKVFMLNLCRFRKELCSSMVLFSAYIMHLHGYTGEEYMEPTLTEVIDDDEDNEPKIGGAIVKHEKPEVIEDGIWLTISMASLGFLSVAVVSKICLLLYGKHTQQGQDLRTEASSFVEASDCHDDSISWNSQATMWDSDLDIASVDSLDVKSLDQEQISLPATKPAIYKQEQDAVSVESGSIEDENMGPYPTVSCYGAFGRPGRNIAS